MDTVQFKKFVDSLKDVNLSVSTKVQNYSNLRNILSNKLTKEDVVKNETILRSLLDCIKSDLLSESFDLRRSVLIILGLICKSTWKTFIIQHLTDLCIHLIFDVAITGKDDVQKVVLECFQCVLVQLILQNDCDPEKLLLKVNKDASKKKILELLENAYKNVPSQQRLLFFYEKIIPAMFNTTNADIRGCLVEFILASLPKFEIGLLSPDKLEKFKICTKKTYVERTSKLLEADDPHWSKIWIFLVRCHGKGFHTPSDIINALLKVVECAFRSKIVHSNSAAYDCWKELINVYSSDLEQMCTPKYMKLLLLPLRTNALKHGNIIKKRFTVWTYLISILQQKSYELCIRQFFQFCFGPLDENPLITRGNPSIGSPARNYPELWLLSAQALLEIMGHKEHDHGNNCIDYLHKPLLKLEKPLVTNKNFMVMDYIIINSVGECCSLMLNQINKENMKNVYVKTMACLWDSLFNIIEQLPVPDQDNTIRRVTALLAVYIELSEENPANFEYILKPIFELLSSKKLYGIDVPRFNTQLFFPLLKKFLKHNDTLFLSGRSTILELLSCSKNTENKISWLEETLEIFLNTDIKKTNIKGLSTFWVDCADVLNDVCEFPTAYTGKVIHKVGVGFMVWPVLINIYQIPLEQEIIIKNVTVTWSNTFASMLQRYTKESLTILTDIQENINRKHYIAAHVGQFLPVFKPLLDTEPNHKFVMTLLQVTVTLLSVPEVTKIVKSHIQPTILLIMDYFTTEIDKTKFSDFQHLCGCFEHILDLHKEYSILKPMLNFFDKIPESFRKSVPQSLHKLVNDLKTHSNVGIAQDAQKLLAKFIIVEPEQTVFLQPTSRAAKITNMAVATPKSPKIDTNLEGSTMLRLLGHKVESPSPIRVRGSQMESSSSKPKKRKAANIFTDSKQRNINIDDDEASYVLIDHQYQFDPTKLTEHQTEVLKKRRTDIPALYQDLSQSQSNSQSFLNVRNNSDNQNGGKSELSNSEQKQSNTQEKCTSEDLFHTEEDIINKSKEQKNKNTCEGVEIQNKSVSLKSEEKAIVGATEESLVNKNTPHICHGRGRPSKSKHLKKVSPNLKEKIKESSKNVIKNRKNISLDGSKIDLKIKNPSMKKIEAMISEDSPSSNYNQGFISVLVNQNVENKSNDGGGIEENKIQIDEGKRIHKNQDPNLQQTKRIQKIQKELNKIKMDIVGGDSFVQNLDFTERIRTRRSTDAANLQLRSGSKIAYDSDDSKSSNGSDSSRKTILRATVKIVDKISKDKLSSSPKNKFRQSPIPPRSPSRKNQNNDINNKPKNSTVQRKLVLEDTNMEIGKEKEPLKTRRRSITLDKPLSLEERNNTRKCKSVSPDEKNISNKKKSRSDQNWIAQVNQSLDECVKRNITSRVRKSLANALESASKTSKSLIKNSEYTVTLVGNPESQNSEDVIESSQESCIEIKPCQNLDKSLDGTKKGTNLEMDDAVMAQLKEENSGTVQTKNVESTLEAESTSTQDTNNKILSSFSPDELMNKDLTSHIQSKQNETCEMDTETLDLLFATPTKSIKIPTSPIASDTPTRTTELINNTLNISPIKVVPTNIIIKDLDSEQTPDLFDILNKEKNDIKSLSPPPENNNGSESVPYQQPSCSTNRRSLKLLKMVPHTPALENQKILKIKLTAKPYVSLPKTHRIMKMMETFEKKSDPENAQEVIQVEDQDEEPKNLILEKDVLKFVKELPSPMASPRYSILKRSAPDSRDEGLSPPRKKRVNFSDPPTTCEKVFFKDKNEHKKKDEYSDDHALNLQAMENISSTSTNTDPPILEPMEYTEPPLLEVVNPAQTLITNNSDKEQPEEINSENETESLGMQTQGSVDTTVPSHLLEYNEPILPELIHCKDSLDCVLEKLANPLFCFTLSNELDKKHIFTIGDLAKLSEVEVTRLPFKTPKVLVVRSTLRKFISQKNTTVQTKPNEDIENKSSTKIEDQSNSINNDEEQKTQLQTGNQHDSKLSSPTSGGSKIKIVSSVILKPAHTVTQSPKTERGPRRVPLINVTSLNTASCSTFKQVEPAVEIEPVNSKICDSSKAVTFGNMEEREKLRIRIPELIADFQEMREKVKRQGLSTTSLYELIIEIVGTEEFVSILQGNNALSINDIVKNDGWSRLIEEILHNIGLNKTVSFLCNAKNVTPFKLVDSIIEHITTKEDRISISSSLTRIAYSALKDISLSNILRKYGMRRSIDALCEMNKNSEFTVEDFFQHATFRFSPSLDDMVPSFGNINIVRLGDESVQLSNTNKKSLENFLQKIGAVVKEPAFFGNLKNQFSTSKDIVKSIPEEKKEEVWYSLFNEFPISKQEKVAKDLVDKMSIEKQTELSTVNKISTAKEENEMLSRQQKEIAFAMFDKMSLVEAINCWTDYLKNRISKT